jgi:threonylcarbamoyladenosine tRNA methylthiotransferase CDKAL1
MEDIEDMFKNDDGSDQKKRIVKSKVMRKQKVVVESNYEPPHGTGLEEQKEDGIVSKPRTVNEIGIDSEENVGNLPGRQKIFVKTYGCSHNISDSEYMAGLLSEYGFKLVDKMEEADACLLNSCTVKNPS